MSPANPPITALELQTLSTKAIAAKDVAYCPYSNFRVGAAILTASGEYVIGANVENVSYPVGTCAERAAFGTAIVAGHKDFRALAVASDVNPGVSPCGMCRQFIREFAPKSFPVYLYGANGEHKLMTMEELLPDSFSPKDLNG